MLFLKSDIEQRGNKEMETSHIKILENLTYDIEIICMCADWHFLVGLSHKKLSFSGRTTILFSAA